MSALEAVIAAGVNRLRRTNTRAITNPAIVDCAGKSLVGISRNRPITYWADNTSPTSGQFYTSTDDGVTSRRDGWSRRWRIRFSGFQRPRRGIS